MRNERTRAQSGPRAGASHSLTRPLGPVLPVLAVLVLTMLALGGCAMVPKTDPVVERAQARWDALVAGNLETAYTYYSPGYRSSTSLIDFGVQMRTRQVRWTAATYKDHSCEGDRCEVRFDVGFRVPRPVPGLNVYDGTDVVEDTWIRSDGQWWYLPKK